MKQKVRIKLRSLGVTDKPYTGEVPSPQPVKAVTRYPSIHLSSREIEKLKDADVNAPIHLVFEGKVQSIRKADEYDVRNGNMAEDDVSVEIKLVKGDVAFMPEDYD